LLAQLLAQLLAPQLLAQLLLIEANALVVPAIQSNKHATICRRVSFPPADSLRNSTPQHHPPAVALT
jgi:hypothetical protein